MGEKERGAVEDEQRQTQQASFGERAARPREAGDQREGGGISHEDDWGSQTPAGVATAATAGGVGRQTPKTDFGDKMQPGGDDPPGIAIGDPGVNGNITGDPPAAAINSSHSNIKNLLDDGPGAGGPATDTAIVKAKSNITNNRTE